MKLYHGTSKENAEKIASEGIKAFELIKGVPKTGYVYLTYQRGLAETYGEAVFEVESEVLDQAKLDTYQEGIGLIHNYNADIPASLIKRIL